MIILGIDPALRNTGWGIIRAHQNKLHYIACGSFSVKANLALEQRLLRINMELAHIINQINPDHVAIEETFMNKNAKTCLLLGHARGAALLTVSLASIPVFEYAARLVKKSVVGVGKADKEQVQQMVRYLLPSAIIDSHDAADALAIAICHSLHAKHAHLTKALTT